MKKRLTRPVKIAFLVKAGDYPPLRIPPNMTKPVKIAFMVTTKSKRRVK